MDLRAVGKEVRARRESIGLTQDRVAKLAHLSRQTVQRLEAGTIKDLGFQRMTSLLGVLGLSFDSVSLDARMVVMAVEEAARQGHRPPAEIWLNVAKLARKHSDERQGLWLP